MDWWAPNADDSSDESDGQEALLDLVDRLERIPETDEPILHTAIADIRDLFGMDSALAFGVTPGPVNWMFDSAHRASLSDSVFDSFERFVNAAPIRWGAWDPGCPEPDQRNRALRTRDLYTEEELLASPVASFLESTGLIRSDQLRVLVCDGPALLAWVGGFRRRPYSIGERARLGKLAPALQRRLRLERQLRAGGLARASLAVALESLSVAALIVTSDGRVESANSAARGLMKEGRVPKRGGLEALRQKFELTPIDAMGMRLHYLAIHRGGPGERSARIEAAAQQWQLTPRETQVLALLAQGDANKLVGHKLGCRARTVEIHVSSILRKAKCGSRAEVIARVWESK